MLSTARKELEKALKDKPKHGDELFADFMALWLESMRKRVKKTTFGGYQENVLVKIVPYFRKRGILLRNITAAEINAFYDEMAEQVKANTVLKYHANIHKALKEAKMFDVIAELKRPNPGVYRGKFLKLYIFRFPVYSKSQISSHCLTVNFVGSAYWPSSTAVAIARSCLATSC